MGFIAMAIIYKNKQNNIDKDIYGLVHHLAAAVHLDCSAMMQPIAHEMCYIDIRLHLC